jgi:hypothetical protein
MTASRPTEETIILIRAVLTRIFPIPAAWMKSPTLAWPKNSECGGRLAERTASQRFALLYWTDDSKRVDRRWAA